MTEKNSTKPMNVTNPAYQAALKKRIKELQPENEDAQPSTKKNKIK